LYIITHEIILKLPAPSHKPALKCLNLPELGSHDISFNLSKKKNQKFLAHTQKKIHGFI